jgi:hypothetical protein
MSALKCYRPRRPRNTPLHKLFTRYWQNFLAAYDERFAAQYGSLRAVARRAGERYLKCGVFDYGFARVRCPDCGHDFLVAYSCKCRGLCPSCHKKRQLIFGEFLAQKVLADAGHRHIVFSIPRRIRHCFRYDRKLLSKLARCAYETVHAALREAMSPGRPGAVAAVQTFGNLLDFHPHVHMLVSWGLFAPDGGYTGMPDVPDDFEDTLAALFQHRVFRMLLDKGAIGEDVVENMLSWQNSGFHVHVGGLLLGADRRALEAVGEYLVRGPISLERLSLSDDGNRVVLDGGKVHPRHGGSIRIWDPLRFLAELTAHIPGVHEKTVIYYGHYSHRVRGERKKTARLSAVADVTTPEERAPAHVRANWARLIRKVYEVDPLLCPECGGTMKIIAFIEDPDVIFRILKHLNMLEKDEENAAARGPPEAVLDTAYSQIPPEYPEEFAAAAGE